ncbi:MAG: tetratricopeptide repeat protein, partial [Verrucomicrobiota bacterium]
MKRLIHDIWHKYPWIPMLFLGCICYFNATNTPFLFDDLRGIIENPGIRQLWPPTAVMEVGADETPWGRPVVAYSLAFNYAISQLATWSYHLTNLLIFITAAWLLFQLIRLSLNQPHSIESLRSQSHAIAFFTTALWLVHPLATNVITYTVQRAESLMILFYLLTIYLTARLATDGSSRSTSLFIWACCALGMSSKETMVTAPLTVLLFDWCILKSDWTTIWQKRRIHYLGLFATWGILALWMFIWPRTGSVGGNTISPWDYFLMQWQIIPHYVHLTFWPLELALDYEWRPTRLLQAWPYGLILLLGFSFASWSLFAKRSAVGFLLFSVFVILSPTSSFIPIHTSVAAEHRFVLPAACLLTLIVTSTFYFFSKISKDHKTPLSRVYSFFSILIACSVVLTIQRNTDFRNPTVMWRDITNKQPWNSRAWNNLGGNLMFSGKRLEAERCFRKALLLNPKNDSAYSNLAVIIGDQKNYQECFRLLEKALSINPDQLNAQFNLALYKELNGQE